MLIFGGCDSEDFLGELDRVRYSESLLEALYFPACLFKVPSKAVDFSTR